MATTKTASRHRTARPNARPLWTGSISFGIVHIPVKLMTAVRDHDLHAHQISQSEHKRIRYRKVAEGTDEEVESSDIVKGYAVSRGRYVVFTADELDRLGAKKSKVIEISAFVDLAEIDPRLFDKPYYLIPADEAAGKAYRLLVEALRRTKRVGIAQLIMHEKEHLVTIRHLDDLLCLETLHFHDELIDPKELTTGKLGKVTDKELAMAEQLVESLSEPFKPASYKDEYRERLQAAITRKAKGKTIEIGEEDATPDDGKTIDLMEALRQSVAKHGKSARASAPARKKPARPRRKAS